MIIDPHMSSSHDVCCHLVVTVDRLTCQAYKHNELSWRTSHDADITVRHPMADLQDLIYIYISKGAKASLRKFGIWRVHSDEN